MGVCRLARRYSLPDLPEVNDTATASKRAEFTAWGVGRHMATPEPKEKREKPIYLSDGTLWTPYPPLKLKPPELRLSIEDMKNMRARGTPTFPRLPESNPDLRAKVLKLLESEPMRKTVKPLLDDFETLKELFLLYSDRSVETETRIKASRWLNHKVSLFGGETLQSAAITGHKELQELVRDSLWVSDCNTGLLAPSDILDYLRI